MTNNLADAIIEYSKKNRENIEIILFEPNTIFHREVTGFIKRLQEVYKITRDSNIHFGYNNI